MEKGTVVVKYIQPGEFKERVWGVDQFNWIKDGKPGSDHAPAQDILDFLGYMIPLTPDVDPLTEFLVVGGYTIAGGIISKAVRDLTPQEITDAEALAAKIAEDAANLAALKAWKEVLTGMLYWDDMTYAQADELVNQNMTGTTAEIIGGIKLMIKKLAHSQIDNVTLARMMYEAGIIPGKNDI